MLRVDTLVSGGGTNLQAILDTERNGVIHHAKVVYVLSNNAAAYALQRAAAAGVANKCISSADFPGRETFHRALLGAVEREKLDLIVLAGYLVKIPGEMIRRYHGRILNIHPSLIPSFCGEDAYDLKVHKQAPQRGAKVIGATVHLVDEGFGEGLILLQRAVEVKPGDTSKTSQRRVMGEVEWILLPRAVEEATCETSGRGDGV